jgi:hypothetical protein
MKANDSTVLATPFPGDLADKYATLSFSPAEVKVPAGGRTRVTVSATPNPEFEANRLAVWSGWVNITASDGESYVLAYQGATGSMKSLQVISKGYLIAVPPNVPENLVLPPLVANFSFTLPPMGTANVTNTTITNSSLPGFQLELATGTSSLNVLIVSANTSEASQPAVTYDFVGVKALGQHRNFPRDWQTRDSFTLRWDGELADGKFAPEGSYKFVFAVLKIFGDPSKKADWEILDTRPFNIKYGQIKEPLTIVTPSTTDDLEKRAAWYYNADKSGKPTKKSIWARWLNLDTWFW